MARDDVNFIFDLDGTLVDSVYQHVMAWQEALQAEHIDLSTWRIHRRIGMSDITSSVVIGDSIWDMLAAWRARGLGVGVLSGGYGQDELERAGAMRVYEDPADLLRHIDEIGGRA
jgi:phosphoglycolate phosphatase-like HAD superfamily hydrolase